MKDRHTLPVLLLVFVVLAAGIIAAGSLLYRNQQDSCRAKAELNLTAVADLKVSELSVWRKERLADAKVFYKNNAFSALVRRYIERPQDSPLQEELRTWISHFQVSYHYDRVALLDAAGNKRISVPDTDEPLSSATSQKASEVLRSGQLTFEDFHRNEYSQEIYLRLLVPILDEQDGGRPLGVLMLRIDPSVYLYPFIQRWPTPSETAETLLIRREGNEAVYLNELKFRKNTALALRVSLDNTNLPSVKAVLGHEGIVEGVDYRGVPVLAAVRAVPDSPWFLVAEIDAAEVYAPMRKWLWLTVIFVCALLFGVAAAVGFVWWQQHTALYREKYETEHKYRAIVEASADGILMADIETKMLKYPNPALCRLLGYTEQELNTMAVADILQKDTLHNSLAEFERLARNEGKGLAQDIPCLRKDGTVVYADINTTHVTIGGRNCLVGVFRDITERKQTEEKLLELKAVVEQTVDGIALADLDGHIRFVNGAWARMHGYSVDELIGRHLGIFHTGAQLETEVNPFIEQLLETGSGQREIGHVRRNGATFPAWMSCTVLTGADQKPCGLIGTAIDITERKWNQAVQEKLLARQQDINLLQQSLLEPIPLKEKLRKVTDGIVRIFDADFCRVWLIRPGDLCQGECIHAKVDDGPHVCRYRDRCLHLLASSGRYTHIDGQTHRRVPFGCYKIGRIASAEDHKFLTNDAPNDPRVHNHQWARELGLVSFAGYQIRDPGDYVLGVLALFAKHPIDESEDAMLEGLSATVALVVEEAAAQEALRQSKEEAENYAAALESANHALEASNHLAESANRAKSEFLANMSHEIRTPMTAILGYADLMLDENVGRTAREHVAVIKRNGEHLIGLINNILDLSKIETGKLQVEPIRCSPVQLVAEVVSLMRAQAAAKQLKLKTELAGPLPETVLTDPLRLRQVLVNLLSNAIKFTDQGEVRLAVRLISDCVPPRLQLEVADTGIGMNEEQVGKLFKPFSQVDSSSTRKFGGTGLGLCISKHLAEALGGDIEVRSNPGKGSTFIVTINPGPLDGIQMIPNAKESLLDRPPTTTAATPDKIVLHGRILLAEDGLDNQRLICLLLRRAGADVTAVENGQLAVEVALAARVAGEPFDVILMDMQMPGMDGYTATQQLRKRGYTAPIVALTAHAMAEDCQKCLDAGCDDYLAKPIDRQRLLATVAPWAARGRTQNDSPDFSTNEIKTSTTTLPAFVYSHLAADPDVGKLVNRFVQTMPERINTLDAQAKSRDWNQLAETAHQIKGAAGSYGFDEITPYAVRLEAAARDAKREEQILSALDELLSLCRRVRSGKPQADETLLNTDVSVHRS